MKDSPVQVVQRRYSAAFFESVLFLALVALVALGALSAIGGNFESAFFNLFENLPSIY